MRPWEIARLTDWQIHNVYVLPALNRARDMERRMSHDDVLAARGAPKDVRELAPDKESVVEFYKGMGLSEETARAMADEQWGG